PENIASGKFRVCLEYQIGNCKGPCEGYQTEEDYERSLKDIRDILNGKIGAVIRRLKGQLDAAVTALSVEYAHQLKTKLDLLDRYQSKSTVVNSSITNVDVFSIASDQSLAFV